MNILIDYTREQSSLSDSEAYAGTNKLWIATGFN